MSIRINKNGVVLLRHGTAHLCKSASIKNNTLRYTLHNDWETHVKIRHKKKQSWHTPDKTHSELARGQHSYKQNNREEEDTIDTRLELPSGERFTEQDLEGSYSNRAEHGINLTDFSTVNPWAIFDHPHNMGQGGESLEEYDNVSRFGATHREENRNLEFRDSYKTSYGAPEKSFQHSQTESRGGHEYLSETAQEAELLSYRPSKKISGATQKEKFRNLESADSYKTSYGTAENSFQHSQTESGGGHEYLDETGQEVELSSYKTSKKISSTTQKGKFRNSISSAACCRDYENRENSKGHFSVNPWTTSDCPPIARQGSIDRIETEQIEEASKCDEEENDELRFNSKEKLRPAKGHVVHSWDVLFDTGRQWLEVTLPQLLEGTCKSQTVSSLSFGSEGGSSMELDIVTNLGENYYVE